MNFFVTNGANPCAIRFFILLALIQFLPVHPVQAQALPSSFSIETIASSLGSDAVGFALLPDEQRILYIRYQTGQVKLIVDGVVKPEPILSVPGVVFSSEQGLLGIALDPDFPDSNYVYLFYTHQDSVNRVSRFRITGALADATSDSLEISAASEEILLSLPDTRRFHNGGTLRFRSDKTLYISHGDDNQWPGVQNFHSYEGKILRINRDGSIPADNPVFPNEPVDKLGEIFAMGLRNPFRFSLDPLTDELFIGDVGWEAFEELNLCQGGENFGWPLYEGNVWNDSTQALVAENPAFPIFEIPNLGYTTAIIALASYRQKNFPNDHSFPPAYEGALFYSDFFANKLNYLQRDSSGAWTSHLFASGFFRLADAAVGQDGSLYLMEFSRGIKRIRYESSVGLTDELAPATPGLASQNFPNPFRKETTFAFTLSPHPHPGGVTKPRRAMLSVFDSGGRHVADVVDEMLPPGEYEHHWTGTDKDGRRLPGGLQVLAAIWRSAPERADDPAEVARKEGCRAPVSCFRTR